MQHLALVQKRKSAGSTMRSDNTHIALELA
jgi:hypothetical protein